MENPGVTATEPQEIPAPFRRSRAKIWIRTVILTIFGTLFGLALYHDIAFGPFRLLWALAIVLITLPIGFWMRKLVPMQLHTPSGYVTLSFDRIYFTLIVVLVVIKALATNLLHVTLLADGAMCVILGLMVGRLSGICLRVHSLKPGRPTPQV